MRSRSNRRPPIDICQSLSRLVLNRLDDFDYDIQLNVCLITTETYQTIGQTHQALCQYEQAKALDQLIVRSSDPTNRAQQKNKLEELEMKLKFQSQFQSNLLEETNTRHHSG